MTEKEFLEEMHVFINEKYSILSMYKVRIFEILEVFNNICEKNEIKYFVAYGSLLAQIRDDGFIPWDSDFDVCVPIGLVSNLIKALNDELPDKYYVVSNYHDDKYPYFQMRIGVKGIDIELVHLDIFYLIGLPSKNSKKYQFTVAKLFYLRMYRAYLTKLINDNKNGLDYLRILVYFLRTRAISFKKLNKKFKDLAYKYDYESANFVGVFCDSNLVYPKSLIEPIKTQEIFGRKMMMPNDVESVLNIMYKDYKTYLPIEKRFNEFYNWIKREDSIFDEKIEW